jgi:hypothetical protein
MKRGHVSVKVNNCCFCWLCESFCCVNVLFQINKRQYNSSLMHESKEYSHDQIKCNPQNLHVFKKWVLITEWVFQLYRYFFFEETFKAFEWVMISPLRRKRGTRRGIKKRGSWWGAKERQKSPLKTQVVSKIRARYLEWIETLDSRVPFQLKTKDPFKQFAM